MGPSDAGNEVRETWEKEIFFQHRWGWHGDAKAAEEHSRLKRLWEVAQPIGAWCRDIVQKVPALEICNWNLEESILALCRGIGSRGPVELPIGHLPSVSDGRARKVWAYCLSLRDWLPSEAPSAYAALLGLCDPEGETRRTVRRMLGERNRLKELYVERFCLCLEFWLAGYLSPGSAQMTAHAAAVSVVEEEVRNLDPDGRMLETMKGDGNGWLQPCSHKAFGRYDDIIGGIGAGEWRGWAHWSVEGGLRRADHIDSYLSAIDAWISGKEKAQEGTAGEHFSEIHAALGKRDAAKVFLASLLASLLRAQVLTARSRLKARAERKAKAGPDSH